MAGLLDFFTSGDQGSGLLGNLNDYAQNNQGALLGLGLGLMGGSSPQDAYTQAANGYMAGQRQDFARRQLVQKQNEELQKKQAAQVMANKLGLDPAIAANPDAVTAIYQTVEANRLKPKEVTFQERLYNSLPDDQKQAAGQALLGLNKNPVEWQVKTIKNSDGSESPIYFNPRDPSQTMPVPGYGTGQSKAAQAEAQQKQAADIVVQDIDRALNLTNQGKVKVFGMDTGINTVTGGPGQALANIGGTKARDVSALVDTIKANATFDKLQQMRKSSPTGAALGAVSDNENKLLGAAIGSLEQSQTEEQFTRNLKRVKKVYNEIIHGPGTTDENGNLTARQAVQGRGTTKSGVNWSVD